MNFLSVGKKINVAYKKVKITTLGAYCKVEKASFSMFIPV